MADLRPNRLAAELRDLLVELDDLCSELTGLADHAGLAAEDAGEKTRAGKLMSAVYFGLADQVLRLDREAAQLRTIIVRLECPPARIAERLEGGGAVRGHRDPTERAIYEERLA